MSDAILSLRIDVADTTFDSITDFESKSTEKEFIESVNVINSKLDAIDSDNKRIICYEIYIPRLRTTEMREGVNTDYYQRAKRIFVELGAGGSAEHREGFWQNTSEPMVVISGDVSINKWVQCIQKFGEFLEDMQYDLMQQSVYLRVGTEGRELFFVDKKTLKRFPEQEEFTIIDLDLDNDSEIDSKPTGTTTINNSGTVIIYNESSHKNNSIADIGTKSETHYSNESNSREKEIFSNLFRKLEQKLTKIQYSESLEYEEKSGDNNLLKSLISGNSKQARIKLLMEHKNGSLLLTSMFKQNLQLDSQSLKLIRCSVKNGIFYPNDDEDFFSDLRLAWEICSNTEIISTPDISDYLEKNEKDALDLINAQSLLLCVIEGDDNLPSNHPAVRYKSAVEKIKLNSTGKGTQIDALKNRFKKLTWDMNYYIRDESEVRDYYTDFLNHPMLAIYGIGGVGKTALMMKLVWDSISEDPERFNHYLILTSKGRDQGTLKLLPGKSMISKERSETSTIAKYFDSYANFIRKVAQINKYYDPGNDDYNIDTLTTLAVEAMERHKVLLVIDNFEDFEHKGGDFDQFLDFFDKFKSVVKPESRIIITTRGDGKVVRNPKELQALKPANTAELFIRRVQWLIQNKHYTKINPGDLVELIKQVEKILLDFTHKEELSRSDNKNNTEILKKIGHPATVLLLAASLEDSADANPVSYFQSEIMELKDGKIGMGKRAFYEYCVKKSLTTQKDYPYLEKLVENLAQHDRIDSGTVEEEAWKIDEIDLQPEQTKGIIDVLIRYSFLEKTNSTLNESYVWNHTAKSFIRGMIETDEITQEPIGQTSALNQTFKNKLNKLIDLLHGKRISLTTTKGSTKGQVAGARINYIAMITQYEKLSNNLDAAYRQVLTFRTNEHLNLAIDVFKAAHFFLQQIVIKSEKWDGENLIRHLIDNSVGYIFDFSSRVMREIENERPDLENEIANELLLSANYLWKFSTGAQKEKVLSSLPWTRKYCHDLMIKIVKLCVQITNLDFNYNPDGTEAGTAILKSIFDEKQFGKSKWRYQSESKIDKSSLFSNIELMESWHKIFNNLDKHSLDDMEPLLSEYATVNVNLASIHHDSRLRRKYLKIAEKYSRYLENKLQNTVGRLKDHLETGWFKVEQLTELYLRFNEQLPIGTTIILDKDPVGKGFTLGSSIYRLKLTSNWKSIQKDFILTFTEAVDCNGSPYLVDITHQTMSNKFTVKVRRGDDGELIPVRRPKDNIVNKNWMILEDQILNWANNLVTKYGPIEQIDVENHAVKNLVKATKFDNLDDMKGHLIFVHPNLSMMSSETPLASMIAKMAMNHSNYRLIIDNNLNLATNFENPKLVSRPQGPITSLSDSDKLFSRSGLALPIDPSILATTMTDFHGVSKSDTNQKIRYILNSWIDVCEQNGISKGKAKRLFAFVSNTETVTPNLNVVFDKQWIKPKDVLTLANRMEKIMKKTIPSLSKDIESYFANVYAIFALYRSK